MCDKTTRGKANGTHFKRLRERVSIKKMTTPPPQRVSGKHYALLVNIMIRHATGYLQTDPGYLWAGLLIIQKTVLHKE